MGFLLLNVFLACLAGGAFWIAMRPTSRAHTIAAGTTGCRLRRRSAHLTAQWVKRQRDR
jgi:hypothetical protein